VVGLRESLVAAARVRRLALCLLLRGCVLTLGARFRRELGPANATCGSGLWQCTARVEEEIGYRRVISEFSKIISGTSLAGVNQPADGTVFVDSDIGRRKKNVE
jgi:hypothetical protein